MGFADYIIGLYGISNYIADIDRDRQFWRDGSTLVNTVLDWVANEGFETFFDQYNLGYRTAHEFRQRHLIKALSK